MEAIVIGEVQRAQPHRRNQMLILMKLLGVCGVDREFPDNGDNVLDADEALALLKLEEFEFSSCNRFFMMDILIVFLHGAVFRAIAWLLLHFGHRNKKV